MNSKLLRKSENILKHLFITDSLNRKIFLNPLQSSKNTFYYLIYDQKSNFNTTSANLKQNSLNLFKQIKTNFSQKRTVLRGGPGYTKFGHGRYKQELSKYAYFWYIFIVGGLAIILFFDFESLLFRGQEPQEKINDLKRIYDRVSVPKAQTISNVSNIEEEKSEDKENFEKEPENDENESDNEKEKKKNTFRFRKIIQYENRIRQYSTPDKVFRYFATLKVWNEKIDDYEVFMTPEDFIRSLTYGSKQPDGLGLDSYNKYDPNMQKLEFNLSENSVFRHLSKHGLISFSDYIFLVTLLSIPTRHFEIAFHMFDLDGNGNLDLEEFEELQTIIRNQTSLGKRHRDTRMTGNVIKENSNLNEYFFGPDLNELLPVKKFTQFQKNLHDEVIRMEFNLCDVFEKDGQKVISEYNFCEMILAYAGFKTEKTKNILKRISKLYNEENSKGITLKDYVEFFKVLRSIHDIDTALKFYSIAGASIDKELLKHVSKTVANADLSEHLVEVMFNLFDENGDGRLSHKEFIQVMKRRWMRGLQKPKDTGFVKFVEAVGSCGKELLF